MGRRRPRRTRAGPDETEPVGLGAYQSIEERPDGEWVVRRITGSASTKPYRCPGCQQLIPTATPHVVAWPVEGSILGGGLDDRRHWHTGCWRSSGRGPRR